MFHLHVHEKLVLGEQFVKNYHLPIEHLFLEHVTVRQGVKVPLPELEICVLSLRALLKYRDRDALKDILSIRSSGLPSHILAEIRWLYSQTSMERIEQMLELAADAIPANVVREFLNTVMDKPRAGWKLLQLRRRVRQELSAYQRDSRWQAMWRYFRETWRRRASLRREPQRKMTLVQGGITMAFVGADGSGKSTLAKEIKSWLGWKLDVAVYYLGSKAPSRKSRWLYQFFRMARRSQRIISSRFGETSLLARWSQGVAQAFLNEHHFSNGQDSLGSYREGLRRAESGSIVIFDRFPLNSILDGPKIIVSPDEKSGWFLRYLSNKERALYTNFSPPDIFYVLEVSPQASQQRKPDHSVEIIVQKCEAISELVNSAGHNQQRPKIVTVDADLPLVEVRRQLMDAIWTIL